MASIISNKTFMCDTTRRGIPAQKWMSWSNAFSYRGKRPATRWYAWRATSTTIFTTRYCSVSCKFARLVGRAVAQSMTMELDPSSRVHAVREAERTAPGHRWWLRQNGSHPRSQDAARYLNRANIIKKIIIVSASLDSAKNDALCDKTAPNLDDKGWCELDPCIQGVQRHHGCGYGCRVPAERHGQQSSARPWQVQEMCDGRVLQRDYH